MRRTRTKTRFYCFLVLSNVHKNALLQTKKKKTDNYASGQKSMVESTGRFFWKDKLQVV